MNQGRGWLSKYWSGTTQRSQNWITKHRPAIVRVSIFSVLGFAAAFFVADWIETGYLKKFLTPDQTITISEKQDKQGNIVEITKTTTEKSKTLWDLASLVGVPLVLFWLGAWFQSRDKKREADRREQDLQIADNRQKDAILQNYFDSMKGLLLEKGLKSSQEGDEVRNLARILTLTVFRQLDSSRNKLVTQFLQESGLIRINSGQGQATDKNSNNPILNLHLANLSGANLNGAFLSKAYLLGADLSSADLSSAFLNNVNLQDADLEKANLNSANLSDEANLRGSDLREACLRNAYMSLAYFCRADLRGADLRDAHLLSADFRGADLRGTDLRGAKLHGAKLEEADLSCAKLDNAEFMEANLRGAIIIKADLRNTDITPEQLEDVYLYETELPSGIKPDQACEKLLPQILKSYYPDIKDENIQSYMDRPENYYQRYARPLED